MKKHIEKGRKYFLDAAKLNRISGDPKYADELEEKAKDDFECLRVGKEMVKR